MSGQLRVLLISRLPDEREWMRAAFTAEPFAASQVVECEDIAAALTVLQSQTFDIMLIDTSPEEVARLTELSQGAAIFFVARPENPATPDAVMAAGAADYLASGAIGLDAAELRQAMRQGLRFHKINRERSYFAEILRERDRQVAQLTMLVNRGATTDSRTGWPMHPQIVERLQDELRRAGRYNLPLSILILEFEGIDAIHRDRGAEAADRAMAAVAERIKAVARKTDICGHQGADSLLVLLTNTEREGALIFCQRVTATVESPVILDDVPAQFRCWFGLAEYSSESKHTEAELLAIATERLQRARKQGIHGIVVAD